MTQNYKEWLTHQRIMLLSRGILTRWWNRLTGTSWISINVKFCTWGGKTPGTNSVWKAALWLAEKDLEVLVDTKMNMSQKHALAERKLMLSWDPLVGVLQEGQDKWFFLFTQQSWGHTWSAMPSSKLFSARETCIYWIESNEGPPLKWWWIHSTSCMRKG